MAISTIPTQTGLSAWSQRTTLDGADYLLDFAWNGREACWYLSIFTIAGVPLVQGMKLVSNRPLLRRYRYIVGVPPGEIVAASLDGGISTAGYTDLSSGVLLAYFDASEGLQ